MPTLNTNECWMREIIDGRDCYIYETGPTTGYCVMQTQTARHRGKWTAGLAVGNSISFLCSSDIGSCNLYASAEAAMAAVMEQHAVEPINSLTVEMRPDGLMQLFT